MDTEPKRRQGRPRPLETILRDQQMHEYVTTTGPVSVNQAANHLSLQRTIAYLSLCRLRKAELVTRTLVTEAGRTRPMWQAIDGA